MVTVDQPTLYVLMRTDLPDYVAGKSMAQANHAGTLFMRDMFVYEPSGPDDRMKDYFQDWLTEAEGFGTCIVLGCTLSTLETRMWVAQGAGLPHGLILDPTYPIRDGYNVQTLPVTTCGYVFGPKERCFPATMMLPLFKEN